MIDNIDAAGGAGDRVRIDTQSGRHRHDGGGGAQDGLLATSSPETGSAKLCGKIGIGRFRRSPNSTMQNGVRLERQDQKIAKPHLGGRVAADDDRERPRHDQAEAGDRQASRS